MLKISVIIPCYNVAAYICQCLDSVLNQSLRELEVICVDDGSTDKTLEILRSYEKKEPRVRVLCQKNQFAGVARNAGLAVAQGEYIAFLDGDDYFMPEGLETAYSIAKTHDLQLLKLSSYLLDEKTGNISTTELYDHHSVTLKNHVLNTTEHWKQLTNCRDVPWNSLYKRSFLVENGLQFNDLRCSNDHSFFIHCITLVDRAMVANEYLTVHRQNVKNSLIAIRHQHFDCQIRNYELVKNICNRSRLNSAQRLNLMQKELHLVFHWYVKILKAGSNTFEIEELLREFVKNYHTEDVGEHYLKHFLYKYFFHHIQNSLQIQWQNHVSDRAPFFSVIMPVHNGTQFLSQAINSILLQEFRDFELICVDNNSTDSSLAYLEAYSRKDARIRVLTEANPGAGNAQNKALSVARGQYLTFVDADDKILPDYLRVLYETATAYDAQVVVLKSSDWKGENQITPYIHPTAHLVPMDQVFSYKDVPDYILTFTVGAPWAKAFQRGFVQDLDLRFLSLPRSEDFYFVQGALAQAQRIVFHNNHSYYRRKDNDRSLENCKDLYPTAFWEATMETTKLLSGLAHYNEIKRSNLISASNRFLYNLETMRSFEGFQSVFNLLKEVGDSELELSLHDSSYYHPLESVHEQLQEFLHYETAEDYLLADSRKLRIALLTNERLFQQEYAELANSLSFRIGRVITFLPRKLKNGFSYAKEFGIRQTLKYIINKITKR